jgi:anti-sigma factor RsiW
MTDTILSCQALVEEVTEYLEGGLEPDTRLAFERHVAICPPCRAHLTQMRTLLKSAGAVRSSELSPALRASLLESFRGWRDQRK